MGLLDISFLCTLISSAEKEDNSITTNGKIQPVTWAIIYTHSPNLSTFGSPIAEVSLAGALNPSSNLGFCPVIFQPVKPRAKGFSLFNFVHIYTVDYYLQFVKKKSWPINKIMMIP
jgi:hypothetical protein